MEIDKVLEVLNNALRDKDLTIWLRDEEIRRLRENEKILKEEIERLRGERR
jgi:hypothetical protein